MGFARKICLVSLVCAALLARPAQGLAAQQSNEARGLLPQCAAYIAGDAEVAAQMTCENTIWSILRTVEKIQLGQPDFKPPFCGKKPSVSQAARLFVEYVNTHPNALQQPAEYAVIDALKESYPCAH